jgi:hypothetical protein
MQFLPTHDPCDPSHKPLRTLEKVIHLDGGRIRNLAERYLKQRALLQSSSFVYQFGRKKHIQGGDADH